MNGEPAPQGVYIWDISARFIDGNEWKGMKYEKGKPKHTGTVHLIRYFLYENDPALISQISYPKSIPMKTFYILLLVLFTARISLAQDQVYSQFFNAPNYLNPALNGQSVAASAPKASIADHP